MAGHESFDQAAEVSSFYSHLQDLGGDYQQALIDFNTQMLPRQVETYFSEKNGDLIGRTEQKYRIVEGRLVDDFYGEFQKMIDHSTSDEEKQTLEAFQVAAVLAKPGEIISILDASALGRGEGIKYLDTFEKTEDGLVIHKERIDLTGEGEDLSFEEAKIVLDQMNWKPSQNEVWGEMLIVMPIIVEPVMKMIEPIQLAESRRTEFMPEVKLVENSEAGFWFGAMEAVNTVEKQEEVFVEQPAGFDPVGKKLADAKKEEKIQVLPARRVLAGLAGKQEEKRMEKTKSEAVVFKSTVEKKQEKVVKQTPSGIIPEGKKEVSTGRVFVGPVESQKEVGKKITKTEVIVFKPAAEKEEKKVEKKREKKVEIVVEWPSRIILEGAEGKNPEEKRKKKSLTLVWQRGEIKKPKLKKKVGAVKVEKPKEPKIPIWEPELNPVEAKEIPWWQPNLSADTELIEAERIVVLTIFFLIVNKKRLQKIKISNF